MIDRHIWTKLTGKTPGFSGTTVRLGPAVTAPAEAPAIFDMSA